MMTELSLTASTLRHHTPEPLGRLRAHFATEATAFAGAQASSSPLVPTAPQLKLSPRRGAIRRVRRVQPALASPNELRAVCCYQPACFVSGEWSSLRLTRFE